MGTEPVRVWAATDWDGTQTIFSQRPYYGEPARWLRETGDLMRWRESQLPVKQGECREYVLIPASERKPTADLSPVAKLIAELAHKHWMERPGVYADKSVADAAEIVTNAIAAARKIEGKADA